MEYVEDDKNQKIKEFKIKTSHYFIAAFGLATALSWNNAVKKMIENMYPMPGQIAPLFVYALVMTVILIILIMVLPDTKHELPRTVRKRIDHMRQKHELEKLRIENYILKNNELKKSFQI